MTSKRHIANIQTEFIAKNSRTLETLTAPSITPILSAIRQHVASGDSCPEDWTLSNVDTGKELPRYYFS